MQLIVGTYTETLPHVRGTADGVLLVEFDAATGGFGAPRTLAKMRNPSYLALSPSGEYLYAISETGDFLGAGSGGGVVAFARDARTGALTRLNERSTVGAEPAFVTLDATGKFVLTANYGSGSVSVYPVEADGRLGEMSQYAEHHGSGPVPDRQASAHTHMTGIDPLTGAVLAVDLGADTIFGYAAPGSAGHLAASWQLKTAPGAGPRHLAFHPGGRHMFVTNELDGMVSLWRRTGDGGPGDPAGGGRPGGPVSDAFAAAGAVPSLPPGTAASSAPAAVRVTPSGRHVLVSNRGHDSVSVFRFDADTENLALVGATPVMGECPRDFILTPDGSRVIVASQDTDLLASYSFDDETGKLRLLQTSPVPTPVCVIAP